MNLEPKPYQIWPFYLGLHDSSPLICICVVLFFLINFVILKPMD